MANLRGKNADETLKYLLTLPETEGGPIEDGDANDVAGQVLKGLLGAGGTRIEVLDSDGAYVVKLYTSDTAGIMLYTARQLSSRLDQNSTPFSENFTFTFLQPFKEGTVPNVLHDCTYRSNDDRTRWRTHVRRESSSADLDDGGPNYTNESVRVVLNQTSNTGVAQRSFVTVYAFGEFDDSES